MEAIKTVGLTKRYKDVLAVDGLNLEIAQGELFALLGVNGAGKTTAIKLLSCLVKPTSGEAFLDGKSIRTAESEVKSIIGVSPQETAIAPNLTVAENLRLICGAYGLSRIEREKRIAETAEKLGLTELLSRRAGKLSGGWQRRLSIAMALVSQPKILFLDEPTLGVDVLARADLWDFIRSLKGEITIVLTTHYMEEAEALSDKIGVMQEGRLIALGSVEELKKKAGKERFEDAFVTLVRGEKV